MAKKTATLFSCTDCGSQSNKWLGRCPDCNAWNSFAEETVVAAVGSQGLSAGVAPIPIDRIGADDTPRISTALPQFDRVLGGGIVAGSLVLIGGEPGIGKSTLLLQIAAHLAKEADVLYVSGEESPTQIAMRAQRLQSVEHRISLYLETSIEKISAAVEKMKPVAVIIDSIQTVHTIANQSAPGSIAQVRDSAGMLLTLAKRLDVPIFLVGHITKEGTIAGPKTLEHIVDTVIYFEGDKFQNARLVRACKNRFGPVNEVALFEMHDSGLEEVANPSAALLAQRSTAAGSAVVAAVEGTRPLLIEVQALVSQTHYATPKRMAQGIDGNRLSLFLAVLERKGGETFAAHDVYTNIAGGLSVDEPAIDLGVVAALLSSRRNRPLPWDLAVFGEVGLLGEVRGVGHAELRAREAAALGFKQIVVPSSNAKEIRADVAVRPIRRVDELLTMLFA